VLCFCLHRIDPPSNASRWLRHSRQSIRFFGPPIKFWTFAGARCKFNTAISTTEQREALGLRRRVERRLTRSESSEQVLAVAKGRIGCHTLFLTSELEISVPRQGGLESLYAKGRCLLRGFRPEERSAKPVDVPCSGERFPCSLLDSLRPMRTRAVVLAGPAGAWAKSASRGPWEMFAVFFPVSGNRANRDGFAQDSLHHQRVLCSRARVGASRRVPRRAALDGIGLSLCYEVLFFEAGWLTISLSPGSSVRLVAERSRDRSSSLRCSHGRRRKECLTSAQASETARTIAY